MTEIDLWIVRPSVRDNLEVDAATLNDYFRDFHVSVLAENLAQGTNPIYFHHKQRGIN